jgi:hypothetical protein
MDVSSLLYCCDNWTLNNRKNKKNTSRRDAILRWVMGYAHLYRRRTEEIRRKLEEHSIFETIGWRDHVLRMPENLSATTAGNYKPMETPRRWETDEDMAGANGLVM